MALQERMDVKDQALRICLAISYLVLHGRFGVHGQFVLLSVAVEDARGSEYAVTVQLAILDARKEELRNTWHATLITVLAGLLGDHGVNAA